MNGRKRVRSASLGHTLAAKKPAVHRFREEEGNCLDKNLSDHMDVECLPPPAPPLTSYSYHAMVSGSDETKTGTDIMESEDERMLASGYEHRERVVLGPRNQGHRIVTSARYRCTNTSLDHQGRPVSILMAAMRDKNTQMAWDALPPRSRKHGHRYDDKNT